MFRWFVAYRYLLSRIISFVALMAVAASVALLIIIFSVMEGFRSELKERIRGTSSDIKVASTRYISLKNPERLAQRIASLPGVEWASPYVETLVLYRAEESFLGPRELEDRYLRVVDLDRDLELGDLRDYCRRGALPYADWPTDPNVLLSRQWIEEGLWRYRRQPAPTSQDGQAPPVLVGKEFLRGELVRPGDRIRLTGFSPRTHRPVTRLFTVAGYFKTGLYEMDSKGIIMAWPEADSFLGLTLRGGVPVASGIRVAAMPEWRDPTRLEELRGAVDLARKEARVPFVKTQTWLQEKASLLGAVQVEKTLMSVILGMIVLFSGFMIFIILTVQVVEKTRDLGILQSMGVTPMGVASIFFSIGFIVCVAGTLIGATFGIGFAASVNTIQRWVKLLTGLEVFPADVFYMDRLPVRFETFDLVLIIVPTVVVSLVASLVPAYRAARKDPVVALRYE